MYVCILYSEYVTHRPGVHCVSAGLVQLAALWCAGEPAEEGAVGAERCRSSTYQHTAP